MDTTRPSLLLRIRDRGDADAWHTFDEIYRPMLYRFARARGLSCADAEEVSQHCLTVISERIAEFSYDRRKGRFKGWLRTLVNNRVRNLLRDRREYQQATGDLDHRQEREPEPAEAFERIWLEEHLWHCLRQLRSEVEPRTYEVFRRYVIDDQPVEEVCEALNVTPNNVYTVKWRLTERVAARMRDLLDGTV